jgi:hypothetical protein
MSTSIESVGRMAIAPFFVASGVMEAGAGLALLAAPDLVIRLVFGSSGTETGVALGRLAGAALLSLGAACWLARHDGISAASSALVSGMLAYNAVVVVLVLTGMLGSLGPLLSGVALLHGGMAVWCLLLLRGRG